MRPIEQVAIALSRQNRGKKRERFWRKRVCDSNWFF